MLYVYLVSLVLLGYIFFKRLNTSGYLFGYLLIFSGSFLLSQLILETLPVIYSSEESSLFLGLFIIAGVFFQLFLDFFSKGVEHGHLHGSNTSFSWVLFLGLSIHSIIEGASLADGSFLLYGILIHKVPVAVLLITIVIQSKIKKWLKLALLVVFVLTAPIGVFLADSMDLSPRVYTYLLAFVTGLLFHVSTIIFLEITMTKNHSIGINKLLTILFGVILAAVFNLIM